MSVASILRRGDRGNAVRDLQQRLNGAGYPVPATEPAFFGDGTDRAVREFQTERAIRIDGIVGRETWSALVESGFTLGDRLLYLRSPNLRGDDVAQLQRTLNRLGFDAGREDGILGPESTTALREFQRNSGLSVDGIAGPATLDAFARVEVMAAGSVASVRERDELRRPARLLDRRIYVAVDPGFDQIGTPLGRALIGHGAQVMLDVSGADDSALAERANRWRSDLFVAVRSGEQPTWRCLYYESGAFRSERGFHTAHLVAEELHQVIPADASGATVGTAYSVLRETRMAAVICCLADGSAGHLAAILGRSSELGAAVAEGIRRAFDEAQFTERVET